MSTSATVLTHYHERQKAQEIGDPRILGYKNAADQVIRFNTLLGIGDLNDSSVLDLGCGYGDLLQHLKAKQVDPWYIGVDLVKEFINHASTKFESEPKVAFRRADFIQQKLPQADYAICAGSLGYMGDAPVKTYHQIARMYHAVDVGLAFTLMTETLSPHHGFTPEEVMGFCQKLSSKVTLVRDYLDGEFSILMWH